MLWMCAHPAQMVSCITHVRTLPYTPQVNTDAKGNVDMAELKAKAEQHKDKLAALMITYPSTHGEARVCVCVCVYICVFP